MSNNSITFYLPSNFDKSREKVEKFIPPSIFRTNKLKISKIKFPQDFIQFSVHPWEDKPYQYSVCLRPMNKLSKQDKRKIHSFPSTIQFMRTDEPHQILAELEIG